jgi:hypothetical protein
LQENYELQIIMLSDMSQSHKDKYHVFLICGICGELKGHESKRGTMRDVKGERALKRSNAG